MFAGLSRVEPSSGRRVLIVRAGYRMPVLFLPAQAKGQLQRTRALSRVARRQHAGACDAVRIAGMVQHVEEIGVEPRAETLIDRDRLEERSVQTPLADARNVLLAERVQAGPCRALHRSVLEGDELCIAAVESEKWIGGAASVQVIGWIGQEGLICRLVIVRNAHVAVWLSCFGIDTVYLVGRNVAVVPEIARVASAAAAVLNRVLVSVDFQLVRCRKHVVRQS